MTGKKPLAELMNFSIINLDKPAGPTSFTISEHVRRMLGRAGFNVKKTSHFGTLDPQVTGVIPIAVGRACRLTGFFLGHDKTYVGVLHTHKEQEMKELQEIINKNFMGKIKQMPPIKSSVKREIREREVKRFELIESSETKKDFLFVAEVQGGTYIRKLCSDLGNLIGGAHMLELRRTNAGVFSEDDKGFVNLYDLDKALEELKNGNEKPIREILIPAEEVIKKVMPSVRVEKSSIKALKTGKPLFKKDIIEEERKVETDESFAVFCGSQFVEVAKKVSDKVLYGKPLFVLD